MSTENENFESRLESLRQEAAARGRVEGRGVDVTGGPVPGPPSARSLSERPPGSIGYYGLPMIKEPVWTWQISIYFFAGGLAGMAAAIAAIASFRNHPGLVRAAMWLAFAGALVSPVLLTWDLGRPWRFLNMLRVFKYQSPMSMGAWILTVFGMFAIPGALACEFDQRQIVSQDGFLGTIEHVFAFVMPIGAGIFGLPLATYTGVLIGVTAIPAWFSHHRILPVHFGAVALGSASGALQLLGFNEAALCALSLLAAAAESFVLVWIETRRNGAVDSALHEGLAGNLIRWCGFLSGPVALVCQLIGIWIWPARIVGALSFLLGGIGNRFGWIQAGHASSRDPRAVLASQSNFR